MIAVDWGTSRCRGYLLDDAGTIVARRQADHGIGQIRDGSFAAHLEALVGDWLAERNDPVVMSGMIGSRTGWREVPYVPCPAGVDEVAAGMVDVAWARGRAWIAPGLCCRDQAGVLDVIRGEESQVIGIADQLPSSALVCLPGTHSKWCLLSDGRITSFSTYLTGELFSLLGRSSTLSPPGEPAAPDPGWFDHGLVQASKPGSLLHQLFGARTRWLAGEMPAAGVAGFLSGLLIGHEVVHAPEGEPVFLVGEVGIAEWYRRALEQAGRRVIVLDHDAAARGLFTLGKRRGIG